MRSVEAITAIHRTAPFGEAAHLHALMLGPEVSAVVARRSEFIGVHSLNVDEVAA